MGMTIKDSNHTKTLRFHMDEGFDLHGEIRSGEMNSSLDFK